MMLKPALFSAVLLRLFGSSACAEQVPSTTESENVAATEFVPRPGTVRIPRERNLSLRDFYVNYADLQRPVIVEDYASTFANFTVENILKVCGDKQVSVAKRHEDSDDWAGLKWGWTGKSLSEVMLDPSLGDNNGDAKAQTVGVFDWSLPQHCSAFMEDYFTVPKYIAQDFMQRVPRSAPLHYRDTWPSLFVGAPGTHGGLHQDVFGSAFWQYVLEGTKEWQIIDPVHPSMDFYADDARGALHYHDLLKPGDLLMIPGDAWHQVRNGNSGRTVAVCGNFLSRGNMGTLRRVVEPNIKSQRSEYYVELGDTILQPGFDTAVDFDQGDMTWKEFKSQVPGDEEYEPFDVNEHPISVVVSGAGSPEVNGIYHHNGVNGGANQFEMRLKVDGDGEDGTTERFFELFKVAGSEWWNILERTSDGEYPYPVHYGAKPTPNNRRSSVLPPSNDWRSTIYNEKWRGEAPFPVITIVGLDEGKDRKDGLDVASQ